VTHSDVSRRIANVIPSVRDGLADLPLIDIPFDSDLTGLQVHNGPFHRRHGLDGFSDSRVAPVV
jgi:hypothetical protein